MMATLSLTGTVPAWQQTVGMRSRGAWEFWISDYMEPRLESGPILAG